MGVPASITSRTVKYCFTVRFVFVLTVLLTALAFNQIK